MVNRAKRVYGDNILMRPLGDLLDRRAALQKLIFKPDRPCRGMARIPKHERLHRLHFVRDLFIPPLQAARLHESIDLAVRQIYRYRNPEDPSTWASLAGGQASVRNHLIPATAVLETGPSGSGKTQTAIRCLGLYKAQVYVHERFPRIIGEHVQVVWQSVSVPASGKLGHLANSLMREWDDTLALVLGESHRRFTSTLAMKQPEALAAMHEWRQVARTHFLGVLHLDEVQNFFKIPSVMRRRTSRISRAPEAPVELSVAEDMCLKYVLDLASTSYFALVLSGTWDGVSALMRRLSNAQRLASIGFHQLEVFDDPLSPAYLAFIKELGRYQYVAKPLVIDLKVALTIYELTGGVKRIIISLWICAHRVAFERRSSDELRISDFKEAADTFLAPLRPAVQALLSGDPDRLRKYEDLLPEDPAFWAMVEAI